MVTIAKLTNPWTFEELELHSKQRIKKKYKVLRKLTDNPLTKREMLEAVCAEEWDYLKHLTLNIQTYV